MEVEVKKNKKRELICEIKEGRAQGMKLNVSELLDWYADDLSSGKLLENLGIIGTRYAIYAIESGTMSILENEIKENLRTIEYLYAAISKSVIPADLYNKNIETKEELDFYESQYNQFKRHHQLLQESNEEKDKLLLDKMAEIANLTEELKILKGENG
ncbi:MAG: hypothetical protein HDS84_01405 [Bacteroidales bacterium]|nr:hypothetical protein [Bacteroidales bacterium]